MRWNEKREISKVLDACRVLFVFSVMTSFDYSGLFSLFCVFFFLLAETVSIIWSSWLLLFFSRDNLKLASLDPNPREGLRIDRALPNLLAALECSVLPFQVLISNPTKEQMSSKLELCFAITLELSRPFVSSKSSFCRNEVFIAKIARI